MNPAAFYVTFTALAAALLFCTERTVTMPTIVLLVAIAASVACGASGVDIALAPQETMDAVQRLVMSQCGDSVGTEGTLIQYSHCMMQAAWESAWAHLIPQTTRDRPRDEGQ